MLEEKLKRLTKESEEELRAIGLGNMLKKNITYTINYRAKKRLGQCCYKKDINISSWLLEVGSDKDIKDTIIHEILHTFEDTKGHNARWQYYARYVNNRTDYNIKTTANIEDIYKRANKENEYREHYKWEITCLGCNKVWKQQRMTKSVLISFKHKMRVCPYCRGHNFKIVDLSKGIEV